MQGHEFQLNISFFSSSLLSRKLHTIDIMYTNAVATNGLKLYTTGTIKSCISPQFTRAKKKLFVSCNGPEKK